MGNQEEKWNRLSIKQKEQLIGYCRCNECNCNPCKCNELELEEGGCFGVRSHYIDEYEDVSPI